MDEHTNIQNKSNAIGEYLQEYDLDVFTSLYTVIINISEVCSRTCSFCPRGNEYVTPSGLPEFIKLSVIDQLVEQLKDNFHGTFSLSGFGEPTLHPQLQEIINKLRQCSGANVLITTNGDFPERLVNLDVDKIEVSLYEPESEEKFTHLVSRSPLQLKRQYKEDNTFLNNRAGHVKKYNRQVPASCCNICFMKMTVDINGDILPCCSDWGREQVLGNIFTDDVHDIWVNGLKDTRMNLLQGRRELCILCSKCDSPGTLYGGEFKTFWGNYYAQHQP